jgi:hypothetical protein
MLATPTSTPTVLATAFFNTILSLRNWIVMARTKADLGAFA